MDDIGDQDLTAREQKILEIFEGELRKGRSTGEARLTLAVMIENDELVDRVVDFRTQLAERQRTVTRVSALYNPEEASQPWYTGPSAADVFWPSLRVELEQDPGWASAVPSLDSASTDIVDLLADPHSQVIATRGLVLGHVQSGKTANFTATIAKAADAGYRLFVVLSGVHNALRRQTQIRLDTQLQAHHPTRWLQLTDETRDFGNPVKALPLVSGTDLRILAVVKKNVSRLTRLRDWLREAHRHGGLDTCPVLIIDDESDQASVNTARNAELDRTQINRRIVELLELPRVAYVGYTATPFANVLVNPADALDIYPRSFVYPLPKPAAYFGSRELFGKRASEDEMTPADNPHDMIRLVDDDEAARHRPAALAADGAQVTPALADAVSWFVMATAARRARSGRAAHSSMLVHTTMRVDPQLDYRQPVRDHLADLARLWDEGSTEGLRRFWDEEAAREPAARHNLRAVSFDELSDHVPDVLDSVDVVADNSRSTERLVYGDTPATVVAIGGNTLSRGLTLEGLVSSYFLRSSTAYDSLLQMGRWFGYRPGYGDLPRIWTTQSLARDFEFLADVEDDLRREIERYRTTDGATPENLPVRIQLHPRMQATARLKMQFAVRGEASFSAQRPQTTYFDHLSPQTTARNRRAVTTLVDRLAHDHVDLSGDAAARVATGVRVDHVLEFLHAYSFQAKSELTGPLISNYVEEQNTFGALTVWNVAFVGVQKPKRHVDLGNGFTPALIQRSQLCKACADGRPCPEPDVANIGTLMSRPDRVLDLVDTAWVRARNDTELQAVRDASSRALLLVYPIDKDSEPRKDLKNRVDLGAVADLFGVAVSFPTADPASEPSDTIQVDLSQLTPAELDDGADSVETYVDDEGDHDVDLG